MKRFMIIVLLWMIAIPVIAQTTTRLGSYDGRPLRTNGTSVEGVPVYNVNPAPSTPTSALCYASMGPEGADAGQTISTSTSSAAIATAISESCFQITCDLDSSIEIAASPTAVYATSLRIEANVSHRYPITPGNKVAAIVASGTGTCWVRGLK